MKRLTTIVLSALLVFPAMAAADELTTDVIERWASSMADLEAWGEENDHLTEEDFVDPNDPLNVEASMARTAREHSEVRDLLADNGFDNGDAWASIGGRIINAYGAVMLSETVSSPDDLQAQMEAQIEVFAGDPNINEEQLAMIREQMEEATQMMGQMMDSPEEDIAAVRDNQARLDDLFND